MDILDGYNASKEIHMKQCESSSDSSSMSSCQQEKDDDLASHNHKHLSTKLEDLITCPVHLGMMEDPRILPCGHAFCFKCINSCIKRTYNSTFTSSNSLFRLNSSDFKCPICRHDCKNVTSENISQLPPSFATKQLTDYIVDIQSHHYIKTYYPHLEKQLALKNASETSSVSNCNDEPSQEKKRELISHLLRGISSEEMESIINDIEHFTSSTKSKNQLCVSSSSSLYPVNNAASGIQYRNIDQNHAVFSSLNNIDSFTSNYELMDVETIRENMKKYSEYKVQRNIETRQLMSYNMFNSCASLNSKIISVDMRMINGDVELIVWVCLGDKELRIRKVRHNCSNSNNAVVDRRLKIQNYENYSIVSLKLLDSNEILVGLGKYLVQCSLLDGVVLKELSLSNSIGGMCIDSVIIACIPEEGHVIEIDADAFTIKQSYRLAGLQPAFVASTEHEIWASCPRDGRIAILERRTGAFRQLGTNQIYNAIPSHITVTSDNRVLFLDCHQSRVFWIRKRNDFILIQRISFVGHHSKHLSSKISALIALQFPISDNSNNDSSILNYHGRALICTGNKLLIVRPFKNITGSNHSSHHKHMMCSIL